MSKSKVWIETKFSTWDDFANHVVPWARNSRKWIFRGQSDEGYPLESSLFRAFNDVIHIFEDYRGKSRELLREKHERELLSTFQQFAHLYLSVLPPKDAIWDWFAIMQHYGTPTRMIDFTFSPLAASYFALENGTKDCAVYAIDRLKLEEVNKKRKNKKVFHIHEPQFGNQRLYMQQGMFVVPSVIKVSAEEIVDSYDKGDAIFHRFILDKAVRQEGLKYLATANISAATLFPGLDGFCKSLKFQTLHPIGRISKKMTAPRLVRSAER